jgi:hypothetical protein
MVCISAALSFADAPGSPDAITQTKPVDASVPATNGSAPCANTELNEGVATIRVCFDEKGILTQEPIIVNSSGSCRLDEAAIRLAKEASGRYLPATSSEGKPIPGCKTFKMRFNLTDGEPKETASPGKP